MESPWHSLATVASTVISTAEESVNRKKSLDFNLDCSLLFTNTDKSILMALHTGRGTHGIKRIGQVSMGNALDVSHSNGRAIHTRTAVRSAER